MAVESLRQFIYCPPRQILDSEVWELVETLKMGLDAPDIWPCQERPEKPSRRLPNTKEMFEVMSNSSLAYGGRGVTIFGMKKRGRAEIEGGSPLRRGEQDTLLSGITYHINSPNASALLILG
jgi:hypothetical protein